MASRQSNEKSTYGKAELICIFLIVFADSQPILIKNSAGFELATRIRRGVLWVSNMSPSTMYPFAAERISGYIVPHFFDEMGGPFRIVTAPDFWWYRDFPAVTGSSDRQDTDYDGKRRRFMVF